MRLLRAFPVAVFGLLIVAVSATGATIATFGVSTTTTQLTVASETVEQDASLTVTLQGYAIVGQTRTDNGSNCASPREANVNDGVLRTALTAGNTQYQVLIRESTPAAWDTNALYRVHVFGDGAEIAKLYFDNSNNNDLQIEGVRLRVDLGAAAPFPDTYATFITSIPDCSGE